MRPQAAKNRSGPPQAPATIIKLRTGAKEGRHPGGHQPEVYATAGAYASLSNQYAAHYYPRRRPYAVANALVDTYAHVHQHVPSGAFAGFGVTQSD